MSSTSRNSGGAYYDRLKQMRSDWVTFGRLQPEDEAAMVDLIQRNLSNFEEAGSVIASIQRRLRQFYDVYNRDDSYYLIVRNNRNTRIIGGVGLGPLAGLPMSEGVAEIRELVIDEPFRSKGIGRRLLRSILEIAEKIGYNRAYLETTPQMVNAQKLFANFGFRPVQQRTSAADHEHLLPSYFLLEDVSQSIRQLPPDLDRLTGTSQRGK